MIVFKNVTKQFFNGTYGLKEASFRVDAGELVMVTGPTGSGKTTLMRLLTKEYEPTEGEIIYNQTPLAEIRGHLLPQHRRQIGVVFQDYRLLSDYNVWENVALPLMIARKSSEKIERRVADLLELVGIADKSELFPRELSGGEAQRVGIARALATAPPVIFADEPTGNLDQDTARSIIKLLQKINELKTTVLIATHDVVVMELLKEARRLNLDQGEVSGELGKIDKIKREKKEDKKKAEKEAEKETKKEKKEIKLPKLNLGLFKKKQEKKEASS